MWTALLQRISTLSMMRLQQRERLTLLEGDRVSMEEEQERELSMSMPRLQQQRKETGSHSEELLPRLEDLRARRPRATLLRIVMEQDLGTSQDQDMELLRLTQDHGGMRGEQSLGGRGRGISLRNDFSFSL